MGKVIRLTESDLFRLVKRVISEQLNEIKKDVNEPLWNVYRIPTSIGANGYVISSIYNEQTILGQLIAFAKNKWKLSMPALNVKKSTVSHFGCWQFWVTTRGGGDAKKKNSHAWMDEDFRQQKTLCGKH